MGRLRSKEILESQIDRNSSTYETSMTLSRTLSSCATCASSSFNFLSYTKVKVKQFDSLAQLKAYGKCFAKVGRQFESETASSIVSNSKHWICFVERHMCQLAQFDNLLDAQRLVLIHTQVKDMYLKTDEARSKNKRSAYTSICRHSRKDCR